MAEYILEILKVGGLPLQGQPVKTIEVLKEEIVRCEDCLFWDEIPSNTVMPEYHTCKRLGIQMVAHDYCSRRKRKADEG